MNDLARRKLFRALQDYVNTGDSFDSFRRFRTKWPMFFHEADYEEVEQQIRAGVEEEACFFPKYKSYLRAIWEQSDRQAASRRQSDPSRNADRLLIMLGVRDDLIFNYTQDMMVEDMMVATPHLHYVNTWFARYIPDWRSGEFIYKAVVPFQEALFALFKSSWRARICPLEDDCNSPCSTPYFIAEKPRQKYCSTECSNIAKSKVRNKWWSKHGKSWRKKRNLKK